MGRVNDLIQRYAPFADRFDLFFSGTLLTAIGTVFIMDGLGEEQFLSAFDGTYGLVVVSAFTAIFALYELRHPARRTVPAVRPAYEYTDDGQIDVGLKNLGDGPALYFQLVVEYNGCQLCSFSPRENPIHIEEGGFLGLVKNDQIQTGIEIDELKDISKSDAEASLQFYYSFLDEKGAREPLRLNSKDIRDDEVLFGADADYDMTNDWARELVVDDVINTIT